MRAGGVAVLMVVGVAIACGGRTSAPSPARTTGASGSAGATSRGGSASVGGKTSQGGGFGVAGTLGINLSGSGSTLGGTATGGCACGAADECAPGYYRELDPAGCCGSGPCLLDCRDLGCIDIDVDCGQGMHRGTLPGDCCPTCVRDKPSSCEEAKELYEEFRADIFAKYGYLSCEPRGCAIAVESNRCAVTCGTLVPAIGRDAIEAELDQYGEATCSICPPPNKPACLPKPPASCDLDECTFDVPG